MRVRMNSIYCGPKGFCDSGREIDLPDDEAQQIIDGRYGVPVTPPAAIAQPVAAADETGPEEKPAKNRRR